MYGSADICCINMPTVVPTWVVAPAESSIFEPSIPRRACFLSSRGPTSTSSTRSAPRPRLWASVVHASDRLCRRNASVFSRENTLVLDSAKKKSDNIFLVSTLWMSTKKTTCKRRKRHPLLLGISYGIGCSAFLRVRRSVLWSRKY